MSEHKAIVDHQGFLEAAKAMDSASAVDLDALSRKIEGSLSRCETLLRALDHLIHSGDKAFERYRNDIFDLVAMAQEALIDHGDTFDKLERFEFDMRGAFKQGIDERKHLNEIIDAFTLIAGPEMPVVEIERAANKVYDLAADNAAYAGHWARLRAAIEMRGLVVTELQLFEGGKHHAAVEAPAQVAGQGKAKRSRRKAAGTGRAAGRAPA